MKQKFIWAGALCLALVSCGENSTAYKQIRSQLDSLTAVVQGYEADLNETDSLVASVLTNFQDISSVEGMININPNSGDMRTSERERIKDNVQLIGDKLRASSEALEALTKKLETGKSENRRLRHTISVLKKELALQKNRMIELTEELHRKNIALGALDSMVSSLSADVDRLNETSASQAAALAAQDKALNTVRYCIGTSSDLKDMKLIKGGRLTTEHANLDYFTSADLRELAQIPLMSKKAKVLSLHPESSYEFVPGSDKTLTLVIRDAVAFWSSSKMLIVQVD